MPAKRFPKITLEQSDPLQEIFIDKENNEFSVARLVDAAKDYPIFDLPLAGIALDSEIFHDCNMVEIAYHIKKVIEADLSKPIILDWRGCICDGRHRILKSIIEGKTTIKAKRILHYMIPCKDGKDNER